MKKLKAKIAVSLFVICTLLTLGFSVKSNAQNATPISQVEGTVQKASEVPKPAATDGNLDFNSAGGQETQISNHKRNAASLWWLWTLISLSVAAIGGAFYFGRK